MNLPGQQPQPPKPHAEHSTAIEAFKAMAVRVENNQPSEFGGALVLVSPSGKKIELLNIDPSKDEIGFLAQAQAKLQIMAMEAKAEDDARHPQYGVPRR